MKEIGRLDSAVISFVFDKFHIKNIQVSHEKYT